MTLDRRLWHLLEPVHALVYYAPEVTAATRALGHASDTRWPAYFPLRAAPLGPVGPGPVTALFYSFEPGMVGRHMAAAWDTAPPERMLDARLGGIDAAYRRLLGSGLGGARVAEAAGLARRAAEAAPLAGRALAAANAGLPWPDEPHLVLWQAATILREHRGDGHVAALLAAGLGPAESLVSFASVGAARPEVFASRGWSPAEWAAAGEGLRSRGLLAPDGTATEAGRALRADVERRTDDLARAPYDALGADAAERLATALEPVWIAAVGSGLLPAENTLGIGKV
ncbi:hypothetical protein BTM25_42780 [Actinomadura rubteroloni]|uniref:SalK n=1 Tax=Actinomadura rubteroloni TaxID=1926885 RepID=A0A2P4UDM2_9ACTN|nr:hypothetical protein [Actinomadura rubteroloni]POM23126.1 hypothetical protein BTM25_42780 [Actinomadura rubteroloni]